MLQNIGISEFKAKIGAEKISVIKNPATGKLFTSATSGHNFKCQQDIDLQKPMTFLVEDGVIETACLINVGRGLPSLIEL